MRTRWRDATRLVHAGVERSAHGETSEALFLTSSFSYPDAEAAEGRFQGRAQGYTYSRVGNPTVRMLERRAADYEGAEEAVAVASGMAAIQTTLLSLLRAGARVVAGAPLFGSCLWILSDLLPRYGVRTELVDATDLEAWRRALAEPCDVVLIESPTNPTLRLVDLAAVSALARAAGAHVVVDNALASPVVQRPLQHGADIVVYSATKHIDGQGRCLGGLVLGSRAFCRDVLHPLVKHSGPVLSPFNAWVLVKAMETLALRVERQQASARAVASALRRDLPPSRLAYPGLDDHPDRPIALRQMRGGGTLMVLRTGGGRAGAFRFLKRLRLFQIASNLGDARSIATHPASTTHGRLSPDERRGMGIEEDLIRLSIGLEDPEDLIEDLRDALSAPRPHRTGEPPRRRPRQAPPAATRRRSGEEKRP
jgi:O-succinylhomoserine sulfhydrylase